MGARSGTSGRGAAAAPDAPPGPRPPRRCRRSPAELRHLQRGCRRERARNRGPEASAVPPASLPQVPLPPEPPPPRPGGTPAARTHRRQGGVFAAAAPPTKRTPLTVGERRRPQVGPSQADRRSGPRWQAARSPAAAASPVLARSWETGGRRHFVGRRRGPRTCALTGRRGPAGRAEEEEG